jgi:hypothetical protein
MHYIGYSGCEFNRSMQQMMSHLRGWFFFNKGTAANGQILLFTSPDIQA